MKIKFRKSFKLNDNMRVNINKKGLSYTTKIGNMTITKKSNGKVRKTINLGNGMSIYDEE